MKRRIIWPFLLTIPLLLILAGMLYFQFHYILWNDRIYPRDLETLDLSGETLSDLKKLAEFTELTDLNLSNTGLTFDQYDQITQLLPHCRILWHVPFQGGYLASDTESLTLRSCSHQDIPALQYLQNLQSITLIDFTDAEIIEAAKIASRVKPDFVKTSTGFGTAGATVENVRLMKENCGPDVQVKAAGGIRTWEAAKAMIEAGATRLGTSSGIKIVEEMKAAGIQ